MDISLDGKYASLEPPLCSCMVIIIIGLTTLSNATYTIIFPFLPLEFDRKEISYSVSGYIFAVYSVSIIFFSPFMSGII